MSGFIYSVVNTRNGKRYIGATTVDIQVRWRRHCALAKRGRGYALHKAIRKYGADAFTLQLLEEIQGSRSDLMAAEIGHIAAYGCMVPHGYNLAVGGQGGPLTGVAKGNHLAAVRRLASDPKWIQAHGAAMQLLHQDPAWIAVMTEVNRQNAMTPKWVEANKRGALKRTEDPAWQTAVTNGNRKKAQDPDWIAKVTTVNRERATDPDWLAATREGSRKMAADPEWQKFRADTNRQNAETLEWQEAHAEGIRNRTDSWRTNVSLAAAATSRKRAADMDLADPDGKTLREKKRVYQRGYRARKMEKRCRPPSCQ